MGERWNPIELEILNNFRKQGKTFEEISKFVSHSGQSCRVKYASLHGITVKNIKLSDKEQQFILDNYGNMSDVEIAKTLNRSKGTIANYRHKNGLLKASAKDDCLCYSIKELSEIVGEDKTVIIDWIEKYKIPRMYINREWHVHIDLFAKFLREHKTLWDPKKCDKDFLWTYKWFQKAYREAWDYERKRYAGELRK